MANVLNRNTNEYLESVNTPDYPSAQWIVNPDLSAVEGVPSKYWKISGNKVSEMSQIDKAVVDAGRLAACKVEKIDAIDTRTSELILAGFSFDGNNFSMSEAAQRNWAGLGTVLALGLLTFPLPISTVDEGAYTLTDQAHCLKFLGSYTRYQSHPAYPLAAGRVLKAAANAATTKAELDTVEDLRRVPNSNV